mgnify:CR=1 FL=1
MGVLLRADLRKQGASEGLWVKLDVVICMGVPSAEHGGVREWPVFRAL